MTTEQLQNIKLAMESGHKVYYFIPFDGRPAKVLEIKGNYIYCDQDDVLVADSATTRYDEFMVVRPVSDLFLGNKIR